MDEKIKQQLVEYLETRMDAKLVSQSEHLLHLKAKGIAHKREMIAVAMREFKITSEDVCILYEGKTQSNSIKYVLYGPYDLTISLCPRMGGVVENLRTWVVFNYPCQVERLFYQGYRGKRLPRRMKIIALINKFYANKKQDS